MTPAERASMDERILDRYRLIERIASGGSAEVWRSHDEQLDRPVAVKRLHAHLLPDAASRKRLAAEARAAAGLSHPVIVDVYDVDIDGDAPALVMELVDGESLAARIDREGPLPPAEAALLVAEVADALFHAHQRGVIHRDVKPGNVLLAGDGRVRLVDFGIAHSLADAGQRLTQTGTVIGTLPSMAPEQLAGGPITPRTDLYGLGVVLHEALSGRPPYPSRTPVAVADAQRRGPLPIDGLDPGLAGIVTSCLAYDPADRPLHAGALAQALRDWASGAPTAVAPAVARADPGVPASPAPLAAIPAVGAQDETRTAPVADPGMDAVSTTPVARRRRVPGWIPAALAIAALALLVGWLALGGLAGDGVADTLPSPTPLPTASPSPTPPPAWAIELADEVIEECGSSVEAGLVEDLAAMGEDAAKDRADALEKACKEAREDGGNGGGNGGNGGGNGGNGGDSGGGNGGGNGGGRGGGD